MIQRTTASLLRILAQSYTFKIGSRGLSTQAASSLVEASEYSSNYRFSDDECGVVDWDNLGFGLMKTDYMYTMKCGKDEEFKRGKLTHYGNIELSPSAGVLNYGQGLFEGTKAYRREDGGVFLFRPKENAIRIHIGAQRMCMPSPSVDQFIDGVKQTALANKRWIPLVGKGSLYVRPLLIGTGPILGLAPASEYTFLVYASPVGNYFKEATAPLKLYVEDEFHRASRGGTGGVKSITNYAPVLKALGRAREKGFSDVLYLDSANKRYVEEVSSCNIFILKGNVLSTPEIKGTILEGVTRKSIMDIACDLGYQIEERLVPIEEVIDADEVFCTGTAVGVAPVGSIAYEGNRIEYNLDTQLVSHKLNSRLTGIQRGIIEDKRGWMVQID